MQVILLRHGIAVDRTDPDCPADPDRPLTPEGVARTKAAARGLRAIGVQPDCILTSPYARARETATIAADALGAGRPEACAALLPAAPPADMGAALRARAKCKCILCAGHEPNLSLLLARLVLGRDGAPTFGSLKKAGAALVETDLDC